MKKWKNGLFGCSLALGFFTTTGLVHASLVIVTTTAVTDATGTWPVGPAYMSVNASGLGFSTASVAQGNPSAEAGAASTVLAETFTPGSSSTYGAPNSSGFQLGAIDVLASGGAVGNIVGIHLYALSLAPSATASASYNDGSHNMGPDLLNGGLGYTFPWNPGTPTGGDTWLTQFTFNGADQVQLNAGTTYALEFWTSSSNGNGFIWNRGSGADPGGQMFGAHNSLLTDQTAAGGERETINQEGLSGGAPRTAALALYAAPVPEPTTMGLIGLASLALLGRRPNRTA